MMQSAKETPLALLSTPAGAGRSANLPRETTPTEPTELAVYQSDQSLSLSASRQLQVPSSRQRQQQTSVQRLAVQDDQQVRNMFLSDGDPRLGCHALCVRNGMLEWKGQKTKMKWKC